jgi:hypothetical protein
MSLFHLTWTSSGHAQVSGDDGKGSIVMSPDLAGTLAAVRRDRECQSR